MERCPYCFKPIPENGKCDCRYEESENAQVKEALRPGTIVGECYQIGAVLGRGGFGITYSAFDLSIQRIVAIKEFYPKGLVTRGSLYGKTDDGTTNSNEVLVLTEHNQNIYQKNLDHFYREAVALGKLDNQPHVVHVHNIFRENGTAYIVMEFVEGQSLRSILGEKGAIPEDELLKLLDPMLNALEKVHEAGILHRDIAPDNIMINNGEPTLVDFGAARVDDNGPSSVMVAKSGYSSPEQMPGGKMDKRSDIYSLGATYYKALSGKSPQNSSLRLQNDQVLPLKKLVPDVSKRVSSAVMKAMALKPEDRFSSVSEFQKALNPKPIPEPEPKSKLKTGWIAASVLLLLALGFFLFQNNPQYLDEKGGSTQTQIVGPQYGVYLSPTESSAVEPIWTITPTMIGIHTPTSTSTSLPTSTATSTPTLPATSTQFPTATNPPTATATDTPTSTATNTPTATATNTPTSTATNTPTATATNTLTMPAANTPASNDTNTQETYPNNYSKEDWLIEDGVLKSYTGSMENVIIPYGVTSIGYGAFRNCKSLSSVTIPDSVTSIDEFAFFGCSGLTSIIIPNSVTSIGEWAFSQCTKLVSITIPDSVNSIGGSAFQECSGLTSIIIPDSVTSIRKASFSGCSSLKSVTIPNSVIFIGNNAFFGCSSLKSVTIPDSVNFIGYNAFFGCSSLTSINIPQGVHSIESSTFRKCSSLTSVTIPDSVTAIKDQAFMDCNNLSSVTIPDSVTAIENQAFMDCSSLTSLSIPNSVTSIGDSAFDPGITIHTEAGSFVEQWCLSYRTIKTDTLIRSEPNKLADVKRSIMSGNIVYTSGESSESSGSWIYIKTKDGTTGWIPESVTEINCTIGSYK